MRRAFLWVHMLVGLVFSVYAVLLGVSGSALVFREELTRWQTPQFHRGEAPPVLRTTPDQALSAVRSAYPGWQAYSVTWPNEASPYWMSYLSKDGQSIEVFVDTATGRVVGGRNTRDGIVGFLAQMHFNLLLGSKTGKTVQGFGVFALLGMCVSGLWLWWPVGGAKFASRFRLDLSAGWRKLSWQLHHVTGFAGIGFIAMWAVTGGYYIWLNPYISTVDRFFARAATPRVESRPAGTPAGSEVLSMAELAKHAQEQFPGLPLFRMGTPLAPNQPVQATLLEASPAEFYRVATVVLDPVTGSVLQKGASVNRPVGNSILSWISVLHFGRFGREWFDGWPVRIVWFLMGLSLPALAVTGCLMWWRRVIEPQLRRAPEPAAVAS